MLTTSTSSRVRHPSAAESNGVTVVNRRRRRCVAVVVRASADPLERFAPPHRRSAENSTSTSSATLTTSVTDPIIEATRATLCESVVGDLISLTAEAADGSGRDPNGVSSDVFDRWFVVCGTGTSAGGRRMLEGVLDGKRARILDQGGSNPPRIGIVGAQLDGQETWMEVKRVMVGDSGEALRNALANRAKRLARETDAATLVLKASSALTLEMLEKAVEERPEFWSQGDGAHSRRVVVDDLESATKTAGELLALKRRARDLVLLQVSCDEGACDLTSSLGNSIYAPYAAMVLEDLVRADDSIRVRMSTTKTPEGGEAQTAIVYREDASASKRAALLADMGAQAARTMSTPLEQVIIGLALGYKRENIEHYVRRVNGDIDNETLADMFTSAQKTLDDL